MHLFAMRRARLLLGFLELAFQIHDPTQVASRIADPRGNHARIAAQQLLHIPEAAGRKNRSFDAAMLLSLSLDPNTLR